MLVTWLTVCFFQVSSACKCIPIFLFIDKNTLVDGERYDNSDHTDDRKSNQFYKNERIVGIINNDQNEQNKQE